MGRAKGQAAVIDGAKQGGGAGAGAGRRGAAEALTPNERLVKAHTDFVGPLYRRFQIAGLDKGTAEQQMAAMARSVRVLPVAEQCRLITAAQDAHRIASELVFSVACPRCHAAPGDPCVNRSRLSTDDETGETKYRETTHKRYHVERRNAFLQSGADRRVLAGLQQAERVEKDAKAIFAFSHTGYVMKAMRPHLGAFEGDEAEAMKDLSQEAYNGLLDCVDDYKFTLIDRQTGEEVPNEANPLTYAIGKIRHRVSAAKERGSTIVIKSGAFDKKQQVEAVMKQLDEERIPYTAQMIADKVDADVAQVSRLMAALRPSVRLDARLSGDGEGDATVGSVIADTGTDLEEQVLSGAERELVREALEDLHSPFERFILQATFGFGGRETVERQALLYDGVYRDPKTGQLFSAEQTAINDRAAQGIAVEKVSQTKLNERFKSGELEWEAGNEESFQLALLKGRKTDDDPMPEVDAEARARRIITNQIGVPITSAHIDEAKKKAYHSLSKMKHLESLRPRYRGPDELERSVTAREMVRRALVAVGDIEASQAAKTRAGRAAKDGSHKKGVLRVMAEKRGWVDTDGRVRITESQVEAMERHAAQQREDLADLMTQV